ncbi:MAG: hypothetical protein KKF52_04215 [Nanoarchaeota archaeon]|nr:hypothetical protein [Nanoarchaeota archaeon]MBU4242412.1 hypothetical protein [Nanoarchaeota archaeon]MBU4352762.1 hypothetical protein [Nanoarchaeota archaeon]MCG2720094.1 hypothetical protein [Nanoarchaeota archaeon]
MKCKLCGLCKEKCPVFLAVLNESVSPRGKGILQNEEVLDKIYLLCTLCEGCGCKLYGEKEMLELREKLIKNGIETRRNRQMLSNIQKHGHPFLEQ